VAVALSTLVASFFGMFAGGEGVGEGWPAMVAHAVQMLVVIVPALIAVRWPRVGGSLIVLAGLGFGLWFLLPGLIAGAVVGSVFPQVLFLIVAGLLYFYGRPSPRRVTYAVIVGVPLVVLALSFALAALLMGFGDAPVVQRVSPAEEAVTVSAGQSLSFTAAAQDPDGDLRRLEWLVDGMTRRSVELAGSQAQESFELAFPDAGSVIVEAFVDDGSGRGESIHWSVTVQAPVGR